MNARNKVQLVGHLGLNPEMKKLENGNLLARFTLATNESYKNARGEWQEQTTWHQLVAWGTVAERVERQLQKGSHALIEGKLNNRSYTTKEGEKKYVVEVVVANFMLLDSKTKNATATTAMAGEEDLPF